MAARLLIAAVLAGCVQPYVPYDRTPKPIADTYARAADQDPIVRSEAAADLAVDPDPRAPQMLAILLKRDASPDVRAAAAEAIATRRDPGLEELLNEELEIDPDPKVQATIKAAIASLQPWKKRPGTAAGLSILCPGCGEIYVGHTAVGISQIAVTVALIGSGYLLINGHTANLGGPTDSSSTSIGFALAEAGQNSWFYSIFDAYRDARLLRHDAGYKHPMTHETLADLASAPFRPSVLKTPWFWAGVPAILAFGLGVDYLADPSSFTKYPSIFHTSNINVLNHNFGARGGFAAGEGYFLSVFDPVGVGEESLFRGVIQNELDERFGTVWGLALGSAIFGAVHTINFLQPGSDPKQALLAVPVIAVLGSTLGYAFVKTGYKLETSVAMHFWYDFLLSTAGFIADPQHQPFVVQYGATM